MTSSSLDRRQRTQLAIISLAALGLYAGFRLLPTGTNLNHMDFRVTGANAIEMCDPSNPQFIPVVSVRSPVTLSVRTRAPAKAGERVEATLRLETWTGKPMTSEDLILAHTRKLHLLIVDPSLGDYQHVHPEPAQTPGEWSLAFTPHGGGVYRVFADFTPLATRRGLYSHADVEVAGAPLGEGKNAGGGNHARLGDANGVIQDGLRFTLVPEGAPVIRAGQTADLKFAIARPDGAPISLEPVMDAYAHLVTFDEARGGFAHLHPAETDLSKKPDEKRPTLSFKVTIPNKGRYVIWAQVAPGGKEIFVPFWFDVI